ncbi:MAG: YihY/virulence factor BrkB family protein [Kiritimatiellae bacterium]|jgi:membrane protein|nr:YihY/virulence factor BrkB family protein [Kiritimatiellia bacterium]
MIEKTNYVGKLILKSGGAWIKDEAPRLSAALAFFTMLSLSPLLLIATSVAGVFYEQQAAQMELIQQVKTLAGEEGANVVRQALENASFSTDKSIWSAVLAGGLLLFTATAVFAHLQSALNKIWGASLKKRDVPMWKLLLLVRGRSMALVLVIGFLLVVSLAGSAALAMLESTLSQNWPGLNAWLSVGYDLFSLAVVSGLFFLMFRFLPDTKVDTRAAWIGGLVTSLLLAAGKWGIGLYFSNTTVGSAYGAAGSLVAFLLWIYFSMLVFFFGAEFTHALSEDRLE